MINILSNIITSFSLGVLTPLTAVCVLPLYPGFISYLSNKIEKAENKKRSLYYFGILVVLGVVTFMTLVGLIFTTILQVSLTKLIGIVSPFAFLFLLIISILLIIDTEIGKYFPRINTPISANPYLGAYFYGFFFGAIVIPCNPLFIATLFTRTLTTPSFLINIVNFIFFGLGIGFPLLIFTLISSFKARLFINYLIRYKRGINLISGILMLFISIYYLFFVFRVYELVF